MNSYNHDTKTSIQDYLFNLRIVFTILLIFMIADIIIIFLPIYFSNPIPNPAMELKETYMSFNGSIIYLNYYLKNLEILGVSSCFISYFNLKEKCSTKINGSEIKVFVSRYVYSYIYQYSNSNLEYLILNINITLDKGFDVWQGSYPINWKALEVSSFNNGTVKVYNPNFIPFNLTKVEIYHYRSVYELPIIKELGNMTVQPGETLTINADNINDITYIRFYYNFKFAPGGVVYESRQVSP